MSAPLEDVVRERIGVLRIDELASLLRQRRIAEGQLPADLDQLAHRLVSPASVADAYLQLPLPAVEVLSAVELCRRIGAAATPDAVAHRLGSSTENVVEVLGELSELHLAWIAEDAIVTVQRFPLRGLANGGGVGQYLDGAPLHMLGGVSTKLGLRADGGRAAVAQRLTEFYDDPAAIAALVESAPAAERELLHNAARTDSALYSHPVYLTATSPGAWSVQRGLAWQLANGPVVIPIQVTLAILGTDWTLPFTPRRPDVGIGAVSPEHVESEAATRLLRMVELVSNIVDSARNVPIPLLKSGMIGVRTVRNLAKDFHAEIEAIQMAIELAVSERLLEEERQPPPKGRRKKPALPGTLVPSESASEWQDADPGVRGGTLLRSWWESEYFFLAAYTGIAEESRAVPPRPLRRALLTVHDVLSPEQGFADRHEMSRMLAWTCPCLPVTDGDELLELTVRETELMGVLALGAATSLAHALTSGDAFAAAAMSVSNAHTRATIGADSTAVVFGPPDAKLARFFDSVADRESTGAATTWRFDRSSVRRAFDDGFSVEEVLDGLSRYASGDVPQTLTYLVNDVARTHGSIAIVALACAVVADDEALIAEISAHRRLAKLGVLSLAPTVVGFGSAVEVVTTALRDAGYSPVQRDSLGQLVVTRVHDAEAPAEPSSYLIESAPSYDEIAARLIGAAPNGRDR